jgi:multiple antibiotic resistance protein
MSLFSLAFILFLIMNSVGNITPFLSLRREIPASRLRYVLFREMGIALAAMIIFNELGEVLFYLLGASEASLRIASGVILFLIAMKILFPSEAAPRLHVPGGEPFVFPLAIPIIAGPAVLVTIMLYAHLEPSMTVMYGAMLLAWAASCFVFLNAPFLHHILGSNGLAACERLMGMILMLLGIQRLADGVNCFLAGKC